MKLIAEIGCNHKGDFQIAKKMIEVASICGADIIKFQKRNIKELLTEKEYKRNYENKNSFGKTYGEHREFLEFNIKQHKELKKHCEINNVEYCCSVWDLTSAKEIISLNTNAIKIPSASNLNFKMLNYICDNFDGDIFCSLGMTTQKEEEELITFFAKKNKLNKLIFFACTSSYPVDFENICFKKITKLKEWKIKDVGFSGHHRGIAIDIAAMMLGANYIERHFTLDRTWKGTDQSLSLEPEGLMKLKRDLDAVKKSMTDKIDILDIEIEQRKKLKRRVDV